MLINVSLVVEFDDKVYAGTDFESDTPLPTYQLTTRTGGLSATLLSMLRAIEGVPGAERTSRQYEGAIQVPTFGLFTL